MSTVKLQIGEDRFLLVSDDYWSAYDGTHMLGVSVGTAKSIKQSWDSNTIYIHPDELDELARQIARVKELMVLA